VTIRLAAFPRWQRDEWVPDLLKAAPEVAVLQQPPSAWFKSARVVLSASGDVDHDEGEAYCTSSFKLSYNGALKWTSPTARYSSNIGGMSGDHLELELDHGNRVLVMTTGWYGRGRDPEAPRTWCVQSSTLPSSWNEGDGVARGEAGPASRSRCPARAGPHRRDRLRQRRGP